MAVPTPAPSLSPTLDSFFSSVQYPPVWVVFVTVVIASFLLVVGSKFVLKMADERRKRIERNIQKLEKKIKDADPEFHKKHGYTWDWVLVFKVAEADDIPTLYQRKHSARTVVSRLTEAGLETLLFYSVQQVRAIHYFLSFKCKI